MNSMNSMSSETGLEIQLLPKKQKSANEEESKRMQVDKKKEVVEESKSKHGHIKTQSKEVKEQDQLQDQLASNSAEVNKAAVQRQVTQRQTNNVDLARVRLKLERLTNKLLIKEARMNTFISGTILLIIGITSIIIQFPSKGENEIFAIVSLVILSILLAFALIMGCKAYCKIREFQKEITLQQGKQDEVVEQLAGQNQPQADKSKKEMQ